MQNNPFLPVLGLVTAAALWGSAFIAMKVAVMAYDPMLVILVRLSLGSLIFLALRRYFRGWRTAYRKGDWRFLILMALFEPCLYFVMEAYALRLTTASQAGMIMAVLPLMVAVFAWLLLKERIRSRTWLGFFLAVGGVLWLSATSEASESAPNPFLGNCLELGAGLCATGYMITLKRLSPRYSPWFLTAIQSWVGSIFFLPALVFPWTTYPTRFELLPFLAILYLGVVVTITAYGLYNFGLSRLPAHQASAFINLIPVFAIVLGYLCLGETFTSWQALASTLVLGGVLLSQVRH